MYTEKEVAASLNPPIKKEYLTWIVFSAGILFTLYLQTLVQPEVFFSGDAGVKKLLVEQFSRHLWSVEASLPAEPWVQKLWNSGLYPFGPPFVYENHGKRQIAFHFLYPLLNTPFYSWVGNRGLYLLPLLSVWLTWIIFRSWCRYRALSDRLSAVALGILIFASPLTIYSAIFWEHSLAVLIATAGLMLFDRYCLMQQESQAGALSSGFFIGISVCFRPEMYCVAAVSSILLFAKSRSRVRWNFWAGLFCSLILFWVMNVLVYGDALGMQSYQVVENFSLTARLGLYQPVISVLVLLMAVYFPIFLFFVACGFLKRIPGRSWWIFTILLLALVPLLLPNRGGKQWGSRYLLVLLPVVSIGTTEQLKFFKNRIATIAFISLCALGVFQNTYRAPKMLVADYAGRVLPVLKIVEQSDVSVVCVSQQFIAQEMESMLHRKIVFWPKNDQQLNEVFTALRQRNIRELIYINHKTEALPQLSNYHASMSEIGSSFLYRVYRLQLK